MKMDPSCIDLREYSYMLPDDRIARFPLGQRDESRLLLVRRNAAITDTIFRNLPEQIPQGSLLVFNDTRVVRARLIFHKPSGSRIEIFCLEPSGNDTDLALAYAAKGQASWKCLVGNAKRWKHGMLQLNNATGSLILSAEIISRQDDTFNINFTWEPAALSFAEVLEKLGDVPVPPYLGRESVEDDKERYQTVYALADGSVAAPTAGLHFTPELLGVLASRGIHSAHTTLHVGAGTFRPVTSDSILSHSMHQEQIIVTAGLVETILEHINERTIAVGTTTARTIESIYWLGAMIKEGLISREPFHIPQWLPYEDIIPEGITPESSLRSLLSFMKSRRTEQMTGFTQIIIVPGYKFRLTDTLITNFHMPGSTLLLLVAALAGPVWKEAYEYALNRDFRFLSYGDACLFESAF